MKRLAALLPLAALSAPAQCVMCFRTAAAQQGARAYVLDIGILLLGAPPFLILAGYCFLFYKKNHVTRVAIDELEAIAKEDQDVR